jgi:hypothetical protein
MRFIQARMPNTQRFAVGPSSGLKKTSAGHADEREMHFITTATITLMDTSTYEQIHISTEAMGDSGLSGADATGRGVLRYRAVGIELLQPWTSSSKRPGIKGATAARSSRQPRDGPYRAGAAVHQRG